MPVQHPKGWDDLAICVSFAVVIILLASYGYIRAQRLRRREAQRGFEVRVGSASPDGMEKSQRPSAEVDPSRLSGKDVT